MSNDLNKVLINAEDEAKRMGNDTMLTISFDNGQVKKVMANFARIEKL